MHISLYESEKYMCSVLKKATYLKLWTTLNTFCSMEGPNRRADFYSTFSGFYGDFDRASVLNRLVHLDPASISDAKVLK